MSKTIKPLSAVTVVVLAMLCLAACKTPRDITYFQNITRDTAIRNTVSRDLELKIRPDDQLAISITSASPELSAQFTASQSAAAGSAAPGSSAAGYLVDKKGNIQLYKLGDVKVAGLTRSELKEKLLRELSPYLKDPVVSVRFLGQRVTVLGEVTRPGVVQIPSEQLTVLEAIGQSGDLTIYGKRNNILVIRQTENGKDFHHLNLLDNSVFTSPYFYLQNEDVVYVEPDVKRKIPQNTQTISYVLSGISILSILLTRFIK